MLLRIVQDLTLEEVLKKVGNLEEEFKMSFEDFRSFSLGRSLILDSQGHFLGGLNW